MAIIEWVSVFVPFNEWNHKIRNWCWTQCKDMPLEMIKLPTTVYLLNSWDLNNPMGKWPNGETWPKGEMAQRGKCGSTLENDQTGV